MAMTPREELQAMRDELEMWRRRDVVVDYCCSVVVMAGLTFLVACLL